MKFKKLAAAACTAVLSLAAASVSAFAADGVAIDVTNFPDENFRAYVSENCDTNNDGSLSDDEIAAVTEINCNYREIHSLDGIEYFTELEELQCGINQLTELNVSKNTALKYLSCGDNQLTELDVSKNIALEKLGCAENQLTELDVSENAVLEIMWCGTNRLTELDVSKNTALKILWCNNNQLTKLDVSKNTALEILECPENQLSELDVSKNTAFEYLNCIGNQLTELDISNNPNLIAAYTEGYDDERSAIKGLFFNKKFDPDITDEDGNPIIYCLVANNDTKIITDPSQIKNKPDDEEEEKSSTGLVAGIAIAGVALVGIVGVAMAAMKKKK